MNTQTTTPEAIQVEENVPYLPQPNRVELVLTREPPPADLTRTSFLIPLTDDDRLVLAHNQRRGIEVPGGHIEPGETYAQAAAREGLEEAGVECSGIVQIGYLRMTSEGKAPEGWSYPHPLGYQVFHAGRVERIAPYVDNDECRQPEILTMDEMAHLDGRIGERVRLLHTAARRALRTGA